MEKIQSFMIDHTKLMPGLYVSRKDRWGDTVITTFDIRITRPNIEPVMDTAVIHTIEHLGATYLRNKFPDLTLYFGPMGCRTGFYMLLFGDHFTSHILPLVKNMFEFISDYKGYIPGCSPQECGNYIDMDLSGANRIAEKYLSELTYGRIKYPYEEETK